MKSRNIIDSFNYAINGIIYGIKTQRNLKIHCVAAALALFLSLFYDFSKIELLLLVITIVIVFVSELINTSIEKVVDMISEDYHPLAKITKDVAAGAVMLSAVNSVVVGYILFFTNPKVFNKKLNIFIKVRQTPLHISFISVLIILILVFLIKARFGKGTPMHGGVVSGHAAVAFGITTAVCFITENAVITAMALLLSLLVAQSRVEGKIHSVLEVVLGAVLGIAVTVFLFSLRLL